MNCRQSFSLLAVISVAVAGCSSSNSSSGDELHTASQAHAFIVAVARGTNPAAWHLAGNAQPIAKRAWRERTAIGDFGAGVRAAHGFWACDLAEGSAQIGVGKFNLNDRRGVTAIAIHKGAPVDQVKRLVLDVEKIANPDVKTISAAICGT